jgi:Mn2+/Fe2+ NRAMP family transporter
MNTTPISLIPTWLNISALIASIVTPFVIVILTYFSHRWGLRIEHQLDLEQKMQDERSDIYNHIIEPFVIMFVSDEAWKTDPKWKNRDKNTVFSQQILSVEYQKFVFKMVLTGSDEAVIAYNRLRRHFYDQNKSNPQIDQESVKKGLRLIGEFLLAIRKSVGNDNTSLKYGQMLDWLMRDNSLLAN